VLMLSANHYVVASEARGGQKAASMLLKGFDVDVTAALSAE
jgi:hypothetical protein